MTWNPFRTISALDLAEDQLAKAHQDRLVCAAQREYYAAMEQMLILRIKRLERERITQLAATKDEA